MTLRVAEIRLLYSYEKIIFFLLFLLPFVGSAGEPETIPLSIEDKFTDEDNRNETGSTSFSAQLINNNLVKVQSTEISTFEVRILDVPYNNYFDNRNWEDDYIVVDANQDGNTWRKENHRIAHHTNYYPRASKTADDWFFLPGIYLEAGKPYQFCMMARICSIYDPGKVEVMVGCSPEVTGMTKEIMNPFTINTVGERQTCENRCFYVEQSDIYYFGIHNMSDMMRSDGNVRSNLVLTYYIGYSILICS